MQLKQMHDSQLHTHKAEEQNNSSRVRIWPDISPINFSNLNGALNWERCGFQPQKSMYWLQCVDAKHESHTHYWLCTKERGLSPNSGNQIFHPHTSVPFGYKPCKPVLISMKQTNLVSDMNSHPLCKKLLLP